MSKVVHVAVYSRKSRFTGKGESVENQVDICKEYVKLQFIGQEVEFEVFEDEGFSGSSMKRPAMERLMKRAGNKTVDIFVCYRLDRVSRSVSDFSKFIERLNQLDIKFISVRESFDTSTPMGRAMIHIASVFAQLERETIAERISDNMLNLAKTGRWLGGETPTGFRSERICVLDEVGKNRYYYRLMQIDSEAEQVKLIYKKYHELKSIPELRRYLTRHAIQTKNHVEYGDYSLKFILQNPVYCIADEDAYQYFKSQGYNISTDHEFFVGQNGMIAFNRTNNGKANKDGRYKNKEDWIIAVGEHQGLIESGEWIQIQNILGSHCIERVNRRKSTSSKALLSGLLYCSCCGTLMRPKTTGTANKQGIKRFYYMCEKKAKTKGKECSQLNVQGNQLDRQIIQTIVSLYDELELDTNRLRNEVTRLLHEVPDGKKVIVTRHNDLEIEKYRLSRIVGKEENEAIRQVIVERMKEIEKEMKEVRAEMDLTHYEEISDRLLAFNVLFEGCLSITEMKLIITMLIRRIEWDGRSANIIFRI